MGMSTYGVNLALDGLLGNSLPPEVYLALMLTEPGSSSDASLLDEPVGNDYARVAIPNTADYWPSAVNGVKTNGLTITSERASGDWGNIRWWALTNAATGGLRILSGRVTSRRVLSGRAMRFPPGSITIAAR